MNIRTIAAVFAFVILGTVVGVYTTTSAIKQSQVRRLLETRECRGCDLSGANLEQMNLEGANLEEANLQGANLRRAKLGEVNLQSANLKRANLEQADMGCKAVSFSLQAKDDTANLDFSVNEEPEASNPQDLPFGFNISTDDDSATFSFNLGGCANLTGADLQGATMPDGSIHP